MTCEKCNLTFRKLDRFREHQEKCTLVQGIVKEEERVDDELKEETSTIHVYESENETVNHRYQHSSTDDNHSSSLYNNDIENVAGYLFERPEERALPNTADETRVYILDDKLPFSHTENGFVYPDVRCVAANGVTDTEENGEQMDTTVRVETKEHRSLSKLIAGSISNIFEWKGITDTSEKSKIMEITLKELGVTSSLIVPTTSTLSL